MPGRKNATAHKREMEKMGRGERSLNAYFLNEETNDVHLHAMRHSSHSAGGLSGEAWVPLRLLSVFQCVDAGERRLFLNRKIHAQSCKEGG